MSITKRIKHFSSHYITRYDWALISLILLNASIGSLYILTNNVTNGYVGINFLSWHMLLVTLFITVLALLAMYTRDYSPNTSLVIHTYAFLFPIMLALAISDNGIQTTPFTTIDHYLVSFDRLFDIDSVGLLAWMTHHVALQRWLSFTYNFLIPELILIPLLISICRDRKMCRILLMSGILGYIIVEATYYFFPTVAPAGILHSPLFSSAQRSCYIKFYDIHHHIKLPNHNAECLIAFPSPHVFLACITLYACKNLKSVFIPIGIINISMIFATVMLGFHYFADVLAGILIASISIYCTHRIDRWCLKDPLTFKRLNANAKRQDIKTASTQ